MRAAWSESSSASVAAREFEDSVGRKLRTSRVQVTRDLGFGCGSNFGDEALSGVHQELESLRVVGRRHWRNVVVVPREAS